MDEGFPDLPLSNRTAYNEAAELWQQANLDAVKYWEEKAHKLMSEADILEHDKMLNLERIKVLEEANSELEYNLDHVVRLFEQYDSDKIEH